ncbi:MAG: glycosyltransferase [Candidatus Marinimicrobia bacterium]|nr:glycosyltransferase [Candidatus Neomarinimicrobiota bacterium]
MKTALVHDALCCVGGAEKVFKYMCEEFEEADIYSLCYNPNETLEFFKSKVINVTWLDKLIKTPQTLRISYPIATTVMKNLNLSQYDIVISSSASIAKYVSAMNGKHFSYCYYPTRALWEPDKYFGNSIWGRCLSPFLRLYREKDKKLARNVDQFIAISDDSNKHIKKYYGKNSHVIHCPIETENFSPTKKKSKYFLLVSRLLKWKKVDYAVEAFNELGLPLKIIGTGEEENYLKSIANPNIEFLGFIDEKQLAIEYSKARAVIFTPSLEYGLIPLEANASGTPVIAYGKAGVTETMIPYNSEKKMEQQNPTAIFFYEQSKEALIEAVKVFKQVKFESKYLVDHASKWSVKSFKTKFRTYISNHIN